MHCGIFILPVKGSGTPVDAVGAGPDPGMYRPAPTKTYLHIYSIYTKREVLLYAVLGPHTVSHHRIITPHSFSSLLFIEVGKVQFK